MKMFAASVMLSLAATTALADFRAKPDVRDGDTVSIKLRFYGFDTPEQDQKCRDAAGQCFRCGDAATEQLKAIIGKKELSCEPTGDVTYGRPVVICSVGGESLGEAMILSGWALAYRKYLDRPDLRSAYIAAEDAARLSKRGLWAGEFVPPWDWRRGERLEGCE